MPTEPTEPVQTNVSPLSLTKDEVISDLSRVLTDLNQKSPNEIAILLREKGVKGSRRGAQSCPVANYIRQECAWAHLVIVAPGFVSAYPSPNDYADPDFPTAIDQRNLVNVTNFIDAFDAGTYPYLLTQE